MTLKGKFSFRDRGDEIGTLMLHFEQIAGDGTNWAALLTAINGLSTDLMAITLCTDAGFGYQDLIGGDSDSTPTENFAQREVGLRVFLVDDVNGRKSHFTIPGPDLDALTILQGSDMVELADASVVADLVTSLEADCLSVDANAITVQRAVIVGRRN